MNCGAFKLARQKFSFQLRLADLCSSKALLSSTTCLGKLFPSSLGSASMTSSESYRRTTSITTCRCTERRSMARARILWMGKRQTMITTRQMAASLLTQHLLPSALRSHSLFLSSCSGFSLAQDHHTSLFLACMLHDGT